MSLVTKFFGRGHGHAEDKKVEEGDRLAADRARRVSVPTAQNLADQAAVRAHMEEELVQARAKREAAQAAPAD